MTQTPPEKRNPVRLHVLLLTVIKFVISIGIRMTYPFLPEFARGLGVDKNTISIAASVKNTMGAVSPVFTPLSDRFSRRTGMITGMIIFIISGLLVTIFPTYPAFFISISLITLGGYVYIASAQAYLGDEVPFAQRGRAIGTIELSWSLSFLIGIPIIGVLIGIYGWYSPFPILAVLGLTSVILLIRYIPNKNKHHSTSEKKTNHFLEIFKDRNNIAALVMTFCFGAVGEVIYLIFGYWMEDQFALQIAALGGVSALIGLSEFGGESLCTWLTDKLGKKRAINYGTILHGLVTLSLLLVGGSLFGALAGLFLYGLTFEFAYVSSMSILSELSPKARGTFLGVNMAMQSFGRGIFALVAAYLYEIGFFANVLMGVVLVIFILISLNQIRLEK